MNVRQWAKKVGVNPQTAWRWCREGKMPVPFYRTPTGTIIVEDDEPAEQGGLTAIYARVSSSDQKDDLTRQVDRLKAFCLQADIRDVKVFSEVASGMNENRRKLSAILGDRRYKAIVVEHRDRLARMNFNLIEATLAAQGRRVVVVDDSEVEDDLVRDMTEVLTSFCARLYGRRSARNRADRAMVAMGSDV